MNVSLLVLLSIFLFSCSQPASNAKANTDDTSPATIQAAGPKTIEDTYQVIGDSVLLPAFSIRLQLSSKAEEKLKAANETVVLSATLEGVPKDTTNPFYRQWGYVVAGAYQVELKRERIAQFDKVKISKADYDSLSDKDLTVLIDVFSGRHSTENNLLDCDFLQEPLSKVKKQLNVLSGKLIGE